MVHFRLFKKPQRGLNVLLLAFTLVFYSLAIIMPAHATVVFMYHRFGEPRYPSTNIDPAVFKRHIELAREAGMVIVPISIFTDAKRNRTPLPDRTLVLTVDDGFLSFYNNIWPFIKEQQIPITLFVSTKPIEDRQSDYMNYNQLRELVASGLVTIGNHAHSHRSLTSMSLEEAAHEIILSQQKLKAALGVTPTIFSYPYGEASSSVIELVKKNNFNLAFGQHSGVSQRVLNSKVDQDFYLPRFALNEQYSADDRVRLALKSLPMPASDWLPINMLLGQAGDALLPNPPLFGFSFTGDPKLQKQVSCYASGGLSFARQDIGRRIELRFQEPFPIGRTRINCTLLGANKRWHWLGFLFNRHN